MFLLKSKILEATVEHKFEPRDNIIKYVLHDYFKDNVPTPETYLFNFPASVMTVQETVRPPNPTSLFFDLEFESIPHSFFRGEVVVESEEETHRHLIFASDEQIQLLKAAKTWYLDRICCSIVRDPFVQILSFHMPVKYYKTWKQIPLLFVFMSRRTTADYTSVFEKILEILRRKTRVKNVVSDFEQGIWQAVENIMPGVTIHGCGFHWYARVFGKLILLGLKPIFDANDTLRKLCQRILVLNFLPAQTIVKRFCDLKTKLLNLDVGDVREQLVNFLEYVESTWIYNPVWTPNIWSSYMEPVRSYREAASWIFVHFPRKKEKINFYLTVQHLYIQSEYQLSVLQRCTFLSRRKEIKLRFKPRYNLQCKSFFLPLWERYESLNIKSLKLLKLCALIFFNDESRRIPKRYHLHCNPSCAH